VIKLRFPGNSVLAGLIGSPMDADNEQRLLAENDARMRRLYPGSMYDELILLQRAGYVVFWKEWPKKLSVDGKLMTPARFQALAARERRLQQEEADDEAAQPLALAAE
jgi:hypothetical protein